MDKVVVQTLRGGFGVSYSLVVSGPKVEVDAWWVKYCGQYNPAGYGTMRKLVKEEAGVVTYSVWRSHSCD